MSEFKVRSRKNETDTHNFEVEKLEKPDDRQSLEFLESKAVGIRLEKKSDAVPRLPWQLEALLRAAGSNVLTAELPGVPDTGRYVLGWAAAYLLGDRTESEQRLWAVYRAWKGVN